MSLRSKLTAAVIALLAVAMFIVGWGVVSVNSSAALSRTDDRLGRIADRASTDPGERSKIALAPWLGTTRFVYDPPLRVWHPVSANPEAAEASMEFPVPGSDAWTTLATTAVTVQTEHEGAWRARAFMGADGEPGVVAVSMDEIEMADQALLTSVAAIGLAVVLAGGVASWLLITRSLRPVEEMVAKTEAVAGGDFSVADTPSTSKPSDEIGRLNQSLDHMIDEIHHDINEREQVAARLRQFVADASHELRTPVAAIRGYSELMASGGAQNPATLDRAMTRIRSEAERMGRLVDDLLLLARIDRRVDRDWELIDLVALAETCADEFTILFPESPIQVYYGHGPAIVYGDEQQLQQVLMNILNNAGKHSPEGTPVSLTVSADAEQVDLVIDDQGSGIPASQQDKVFERFYRIDPSRSRHSGGTGLGLAIAHAIVDAHGGSISAGQNPHGGARFTVSLPATDPATVDADTFGPDAVDSATASTQGAARPGTTDGPVPRAAGSPGSAAAPGTGDIVRLSDQSPTPRVIQLPRDTPTNRTD